MMKPKSFAFLLALVLCFVLSPNAFAKRFSNSYVSFELPPNWQCRIEGAEWVCQNGFSRQEKEAIIILTAKEVGPTDSMAAYEAHLKQPRTIMSLTGTPIKSQILHVKNRLIANQPWVDGMQLGSEIGPYFTRYLATIKDKIAILVTFTAHKEHYTKYSADFRTAIESLRVVASKSMLAAKADSNRRGNNETIGAPIGQNIPDLNSTGLPPESSVGGSKTAEDILLLALILGAAGIYFYIKSKKKAGKGKKKKK